MRKILLIIAIPASFTVYAQEIIEQKPVEIFSSPKTINARTTELIGKGKLDFNVTHNFGDIAGKMVVSNAFSDWIMLPISASPLR